MTDLSALMFHDDDAARAHLESILWPDGPVCPHCKATEGLTRLQGKSHRPGLFQCNKCLGHFTVTNGSIMERSHVPLHKWALAFHLMGASKKGVSAHQLHRMLHVNYRTAWFMEHRIRACMDNADDKSPMGGEGVTVEIDETFIGQKEGVPVRRGYAHKHAVMTLIERRPEGARAQSFHVSGTAAVVLLPIIKANVTSGFPLQQPYSARHRRCRADPACHSWRKGQAADVSTASFAVGSGLRSVTRSFGTGMG